MTADSVVHIFDWKTCSWGWDARRKADKMTTYQLTLYKHFYVQKMGLDPAEVETHFALLKRTANKNRVEFFRVTIMFYPNGALNNVSKEDQYYFDITDVETEEWDYVEIENLVKKYI